MLKLSLKAAAGLVLVLAGIVCLTSTRQAEARPQYYPWWTQTYPSVTDKNKVKASVRCNVCHVGAKKTNRNDYGKAIVKALDGQTNVKQKNKFVDALKEAAKEKNADGKTFGDLLGADELPGKAN
jgi:hypothetical protein